MYFLENVDSFIKGWAILILIFAFSAESPIPLNLFLSISHSAFVKGDSTNFEIKALFVVEASKLYPKVKCTSVDEYLDQFVQNLEHSIVAIC
jgi:hypothetical protein